MYCHESLGMKSFKEFRGVRRDDGGFLLDLLLRMILMDFNKAISVGKFIKYKPNSLGLNVSGVRWK